jgi:hypothetical protein
MSGALQNYDEPQEAINDKSEDLQAAADRLDGALSQYDQGWRTEDEVIEIAEEANNAYDALDEVEDAILNEDYTPEEAVEEFEEALQEQGYDDLNAYVEGKEPLTASGNPHETAMDNFTEEDVDWQPANNAREKYNQVTAKAREEYGIDVPLADSIQNSETMEAIEGLESGALEPEDIEL